MRSTSSFRKRLLRESILSSGVTQTDVQLGPKHLPFHKILVDELRQLVVADALEDECGFPVVAQLNALLRDRPQQVCEPLGVDVLDDLHRLAGLALAQKHL